MKSLTTILLLACLFLMAGCSKKEIYFYSHAADNFGNYPKATKAEGFTSNASLLPFLPDTQEENPFTDFPTLSAATGPAALVPETVPVPNAALTGEAPALLQETPELLIADLNIVVPEPKKGKIKKNQTTPRDKRKKIVGTAEAGFALSLFGLVSIALVFITPYLLFFSGLLTFSGLLLSFIGLITVNNNRDKFRGKVRAWVGIVLGLIGSALVALLISNNF